ncbi:MAG: hypothetical protein JNM70_05650 [Anaerolineae bacterium]|nr:hypothetical protein [Anaerolineae bacterium]
MGDGFLNIPWLVWAALALGIAAIFVFFVPGAAKLKTLAGWPRFIARWFHPLVWLLLALSFAMRALPNETIRELADPVAALGGITYLIYIVTLVRVQSS